MFRFRKIINTRVTMEEFAEIQEWIACDPFTKTVSDLLRRGMNTVMEDWRANRAKEKAPAAASSKNGKTHAPQLPHKKKPRPAKKASSRT